MVNMVLKNRFYKKYVRRGLHNSCTYICGFFKIANRQTNKQNCVMNMFSQTEIAVPYFICSMLAIETNVGVSLRFYKLYIIMGFKPRGQGFDSRE